MKPTGAGALFQNTAKTRFLDWTRSRYDGMLRRPSIAKLGGLYFTRDEFREHVLLAMGGRYDGVLQCRYCNRHIPIEDAAADHETPLSRGGSTGLDNIGFPCQPCNARKGSMLPWEYLKLIEFVRREIPLAETDLLKRLQQSVQSVAGARRNQAMIAQVKAAGNWPSRKKKPTLDEEPF